MSSMRRGLSTYAALDRRDVLYSLETETQRGKVT